MTASFPSADAYAREPVRYPPRRVVDVQAEQRAVTEDYRNMVLRRVGGSCLRLAVFHGEYRWHWHPRADELFLVVEGRLEIELADGHPPSRSAPGSASSCRRAPCTARAPWAGR